jgi:creatinine amidohydrolase/Fe(II)-dependent formamide hydrolase-like protein
MRSRLWQELTTEDVASLDRAHTVAVLPVAAVEQHRICRSGPTR